jgi:ABC-type Mn2+/Zn2+ transport system permease subunit
MDVSWSTIWELFHFAIFSAALAGIVCPLVGCFLLVRRTGFYGVALPQFAAAGVALGWALPVWLAALGLTEIDLEVAVLESPHAVKNYLLVLAGLATFGGLWVLLLFARHEETETGRVAASFAIASAATILLASVSPHGGEVIDQLLRGEILTADLHEFETIGVVYGLVLLAVVVYHRDFLLVSFDRDGARIQGRSVRRVEALLLVATGLTVSVGALVVGPIVLFGLLVLPPLAARGLARSMLSFYVLSSALGLVAALGGVVVSFRLDWPLGPALVAVAGALMVPAQLIGRLRTRNVDA